MKKRLFHRLTNLVESPMYYLPALLEHYGKTPTDLSQLRVADKPELTYLMVMAYVMQWPHQNERTVRTLRNHKIRRNGGREESQKIFALSGVDEKFNAFKAFWGDLVSRAYLYRNADGKWVSEKAATFSYDMHDEYEAALEMYCQIECPECGSEETVRNDEVVDILFGASNFTLVSGPYCRCDNCGAVVRPEISDADDLPSDAWYGEDTWDCYVEWLDELLEQMADHVAQYGKPDLLYVGGSNLDWRGRSGYTTCAVEGEALARVMSVNGDFSINNGVLWLRQDGTAEMTCSMHHHDVPTGSSLTVQPMWECELSHDEFVRMDEMKGNAERCRIAETLLCGSEDAFEYSYGSTFKVVSLDGLIDSIEWLAKRLEVDQWEDVTPTVNTSSKDLAGWSPLDALHASIGWHLSDLIDRLRNDQPVDPARVGYLRGLIEVFLAHEDAEAA